MRAVPLAVPVAWSTRVSRAQQSSTIPVPVRSDCLPHQEIFR